MAETIGTVLIEKLKSIQANSSQKDQTKTLTTQTSYDCPICKDKELVYVEDRNIVIECECREMKMYKRILEHSGISESFQRIGFKEFNSKDEKLKVAKDTAVDYVLKFKEIENIRNNSIAFLGNPGAGKTHLSIAIANNLMKKSIGVLYMPYREVIPVIKQNMTDEEDYNKLVKKYKNARVLLIDDLFKGKVNDSDINIMHEIINYRYLKQTPIIVSSEYTQNRLLDFDEAIGSRIIQMCYGRINEFIGTHYNYRLI